MRAVGKGMSLSEFLLEELKQVAAQPSREEWLERLANRAATTLDPSAILRNERDR